MNEVNTNNQTKQEKYFINTNDIPKETKDFLKEKVGNDAKIFSPKEHASYKGTVVYSDEKYLAQTVGKDSKTIIVHPHDKLEIIGDVLQNRAANNDLNNRNVQIHYKDVETIGKVFSWNKEKEQEKIKEALAAKELRETKQMTVKEVKESAKLYAQTNIKNVKQREAFLNHLEKATESLSINKQPQQQQAEKVNTDNIER